MARSYRPLLLMAIGLFVMAAERTSAEEPLLFRNPSGIGLYSTLKFSPDGRWMAIRGGNRRSPRSWGSILIWEVATQRLVGNIDTGTDQAGGLDWSHDGKYLVTGGTNRRCTIWSFQVPPNRNRPVVTVLRDFVHLPLPQDYSPLGIEGLVSFSPTTGEVASVNSVPRPGDVNAQRSLKVWRYLEATTSSQTGPGRTGSPETGPSLGSRSGNPPLPPRSSGGDSKSVVSNLPRLLVPLTQPARRMGYSSDGKLIAISFSGIIVPDSRPPVGADYSEVHLYDSDSGDQLQRWTIPTVGMGFCYCDILEFSPDGKYLCAGTEKTVVVWDVATRNELFRRIAPWRWDDAAFAAGDRLLALCGSDDDDEHLVRLYRLPAFEEVSVGRLTNKHLPSALVEFTPDGKRFLTGWNRKSMRLWNVDEILASPKWGTADESKGGDR